ncbi:MAG: hypothetical protein H0U75_06675 [Legionella sp.]|nr:hypothetical protein [Legionella sp.]
MKTAESFIEKKKVMSVLIKIQGREIAFKKYIEFSVDKTIQNLCDEVGEKAGVDSSIAQDISTKIFGYLSDPDNKSISDFVDECLSDRQFYMALSKKNSTAVIPEDRFAILSDTLDNFYSSFEALNDEEISFKKEWAEVFGVYKAEFSIALMSNLIKLKPPRDILPMNFQLDNTDSQSAIGNLLTANRSDKRTMKNLDDFDLYQTGKQESYRSWFFESIASSAAERSSIGRNTGNRLAWIGNIEGYDDILKAINNIKRNIKQKYKFSFSDSLLAQAIRDTFNR